MADTGTTLAEEARARAYATPLADFQPHAIDHFTSDTLWPWFERLRAEDPVHYTAESEFGAYWSVTKGRDIIAVDSNHGVFSSDSELGGIAIGDGTQPRETAGFISLDPPMHDEQRRVVAPMFSSASMAALEPVIREWAGKILDELPRGETFDFVDKVAIELTSQMLATLFDYPFEQRRLLPRFSDMLLSGPPDTPEEGMARQAEMYTILGEFVPLWTERAAKGGGGDLISLLANNPATKGDDDPQKYF